MRYKVKIIEKLEMSVIVEASSKEEALGQVAQDYCNGKIVVESSSGPDVEICASPVMMDKPD